MEKDGKELSFDNRMTTATYRCYTSNSSKCYTIHTFGEFRSDKKSPTQFNLVPEEMHYVDQANPCPV